MQSPQDDSDVPDNLVWKLLKSYIEVHGAVRHQIESFDNFVTNILPRIIMENSDITCVHSSERFSHHLHFCNVTVRQPTCREADGFERKVMPYVARWRGFTYASSVVVDLVHDKVDQRTTPAKLVSRKVYRDVVLCRIPVMIYSKLCYLTTTHDTEYECKMDRGGYFIVNGIEKSLLAQEKLRTNFPYVFPCRNNRFQYVCEVRSCHELKMRSTSTLYMYITKSIEGMMPEILIELPFIDMNISLVALFRILGANTTDEIIEYVNCKSSIVENIVRNCLDSDINARADVQELMDWIGREGTKEITKERRSRYLEHIFSNEVLPHMGLHRDKTCDQRKMVYLGHMVNKLVTVSIGEIPCDDRDNYANKRVDSSGVLMSLLFRQLYRNFLKMLGIQLHKLVESNKEDTFNAGDLINHKKISSGFKYAFSTGNWGVQKGAINGQTGIAQILSRMTTVSAIANLRRINTPISREGKAPKPRQLHYTSWGIVCAVETPEGGSCGLVKNLAILSHVRVGSVSMPIAQVVVNVPGVQVTPLLHADTILRKTGCLIFVNGVIIGYVQENQLEKLANTLRSKRRGGDLPFDVSISVSQRSLWVNSDPGCLVRPVIVASRIQEFKQILQTSTCSENVWYRLQREGIIEFLDKQEEETMRVAIRIRDLKHSTHMTLANAMAFTHADIHPCLMNGLCASLIPFPDHNQSPRNTYQSAMGKQAIGMYATNFFSRLDTVAHVLCYSQRALVTTQVEEMLQTSTVPAGSSPIVVIMSYTGFNQEDSVIVNQSAIDRGLFRSFVYRTYKDEEKAVGADSELFENPANVDACAGMRDACYDKLSSDGVVYPGQIVENGDAIIGKTLTTSDIRVNETESRKEVKRDRSTVIRNDESAVVDAVFTSKTKDGHKYVKIRTRSRRIPVIGDKLSSRHGQKGVIGCVLQQSDMPFTEDGITPDIIINPHAIPSRMTIGQLLECLLGKLCCVEGVIGDGTPFRGVSVENVAQELQKHGYQKYGNERLYNGMTGDMMEGLAFIGPTYYQRLKHMVKDKHHARGRGPIQILTRQPVEGRSREGGLRFGEMERDCILSHGCSAVLRERLFEQSDPFVATVCGKCGLLAQPASENMQIRNAKAYCQNCNTGDHCHSVQIPYAFKLLLQELYAMNIAPRLRLDNGSSARVFLQGGVNII